MIKVILDNQEEFKPEARYVWETFSDIIGVPFSFIDVTQNIQDKDILLYYGSHPEKVKQEKISILEDTDLMSNKKEPEIKFVENIPIIHRGNFTKHQLVSEDNSRANFSIHADIIAASFYLLSRQEERVNKKRDIWGCFAASYSLTSKWKVGDIPIINLYVELLLDLIRKVAQKKQIPFNDYPRWKDNKKFAVALTHDVDKAKKYSISNAAKAFLRKAMKGKGSFAQGLQLLQKSISNNKNSDPFWNFSDFINLESKFGAKSTFYFFTQSTNRRYDPFYRLNADLGRQIKDISEKGWEIGLHASYESYLDEQMLRNQRRKLESVLNRPILGVRQHYLRFSVEKTPFLQSQAGFLYDSSLGYNESMGFRAGLSAPFFPYDTNLRKKLDILELPLVVMDGSLFEFERYAPKEALVQVKKIIDRVETVRGLLVILWHMKARDEENYPGWWNVYQDILRYLQEKEVWVTSASEICTWWLKRIKDVRNLRNN